MLELKVMQYPYVMDGELRIYENNVKTINVLKVWYEALAEDEEANQYMIYWGVKEDYNPTEDTEEENACDWDSPYMILDANDKNVDPKKVKLVW